MSDTNRFLIEGLLTTVPLSPEMTCSYFSDRVSRYQEFQLDGNFDPSLMTILLEKGYRRCGTIYYQTRCPSCRSCRSYRIPVKDFKPTRSQKRVLKRNQDVVIQFVEPQSSPEKEDLYLRYQASQHGDCEQQGRDNLLSNMYFQMYTNPPETRELEMRLDGKLIGFGTVDCTPEVASAVYFAFDPDYRDRSLGTLAILRSIQWAKETGLDYYYLGYYISEHKKMVYKDRYRPAEILSGDHETFESINHE